MSVQAATSLLDGASLTRTVRRLAHEVLEAHNDTACVVLVGIEAGGVGLAKTVAEAMKVIAGREVPVGAIDPTPYRDDRPRTAQIPVPTLVSLDGDPIDVNDCAVILVDDVLQTGRTLRAALDAVLARGRPAAIESMTLIDRGHRELPLRPNYVGKNVPVSDGEWIDVRFGGDDAGAYLVTRNRGVTK